MCVRGILLCVPLTLCSLFIFIAHVASASDYEMRRLQERRPLAAAVLATASCQQMGCMCIVLPVAVAVAVAACCCCRRALVSSGKNFAITVIWWDLQGLHPNTHADAQAQAQHSHRHRHRHQYIPSLCVLRVLVWTFICRRTFYSLDDALRQESDGRPQASDKWC